MPTDPRGLRSDAPLLDAWMRFQEQAPTPFTIPGHKQRTDQKAHHLHPLSSPSALSSSAPPHGHARSLSTVLCGLGGAET